MSFEKVAVLANFWDGERLCAQSAGKSIVLLNRGGKIYAYENRCAHLAYPMNEGTIEGDVWTCPAHGWTYDVCTGEGLNPEGVSLKAFPVKIENGDVWVDAGAANDE